MIHKHQFVRVGDVEKFVTMAGSAGTRSKLGGRFVCADLDCEEVRDIWPDGSKDVVNRGLPEGEMVDLPRQRTITKGDLETPLG